MSSVQNNKTNNIRNKIVVYFRLQERIESIEFSPESTSSDDLKETFRSAAEANVNDILKLYNSKGHLVTISAHSLEANTYKEPYRLEIIAKCITEHNKDLKDLVDRIEQLEFQLHSLSATSDYPKVEELHTKVKELCQKLEDVEHLSWLGLFKDTKAYTFGGTGAFLSNC